MSDGIQIKERRFNGGGKGSTRYSNRDKIHERLPQEAGLSNNGRQERNDNLKVIKKNYQYHEKNKGNKKQDDTQQFSNRNRLYGASKGQSNRYNQQRSNIFNSETRILREHTRKTIIVPPITGESLEWPSLSTTVSAEPNSMQMRISKPTPRILNVKDDKRKPIEAKIVPKNAELVEMNSKNEDNKRSFEKEMKIFSATTKSMSKASISISKHDDRLLDMKSTDERNAALFFFKGIEKDGLSLKRKKKHLSTLKKKVLRERLYQYRRSIQNNGALDDNQNDDLIIVRLDNFLFSEAELNDNDLDLTILEDDDEYDEVISDVFGMVKKILPNEDPRIHISRRRQSYGFGSVYVEFMNKYSALEAYQQWNNAIIQGSLINATLHPKSTVELVGKYRFINDSNQNIEYGTSCCTMIFLQNVLSADDIDDKDCLEETLSDVHILASQYGEVKHLTVDLIKCGIYVEYSGDFDIAEAAVKQLDKKLLAGEHVSAKIVRNIIKVENVLNDDDLDDDECLEETLSDIKELASELGNVSGITVNIQSRIVYIEFAGGFAEASNAAKTLDGKVLGGQQLVVAPCLTEIFQGSLCAVPSSTADDAKTYPSPLMSGQKVIPEIFAECKRVPKIPNAGSRRSYATPVQPENENETLQLLNDLLTTLMKLQQRSKDDPNARSRRRLVMGLREVARGIRAGKVKMVILAYNMDEYSALDEKLQEILDLSKEAELPVFYNLNKRKLGKAVGKSIKVRMVMCSYCISSFVLIFLCLNLPGFHCRCAKCRRCPGHIQEVKENTWIMCVSKSINYEIC